MKNTKLAVLVGRRGQRDRGQGRAGRGESAALEKMTTGEKTFGGRIFAGFHDEEIYRAAAGITAQNEWKLPNSRSGYEDSAKATRSPGKPGWTTESSSLRLSFERR
jgi:hypothetical protein